MIDADEREIRGCWLETSGTVVRDANTERIEKLTRDYLREVARDASGWDVLYIDPRDSRYWELSYPDSGLSAGGPPLLKNLSREDVREKYGHLPDPKTIGGTAQGAP
jgi:hypothetical protein